MIGPQFGHYLFSSTLARIIPTFLPFCHDYRCSLIQLYYSNYRVGYLYVLFSSVENNGTVTFIYFN